MRIPFLDKYLKGEQRSVTVKKNILASFVIKGVSILISFLLVPATLGYVSAELYGVWMALSSVLLWVQFLDLGFSQGLKNKLAEALAFKDYEKGKALVSTTYAMVALIFVPVGIILEFIVPLVDWCDLLNVSSEYADEIERVMYVLVAFACIQMIVNVLTSVIAAFQKVAFASVFSVIGQILAFIIIIVLTKTTPPSLLGLALSYAATPVLVLIVASVILYNTRFKIVAPEFRKIDRSHIKELFDLGYKFFIINVQVVVLYYMTNILISHVSSPLQVTSYNLAYKYLNVAMMVYSLMTAPLWPAYTDAYAKKDYDWMKTTLSKMTKIMFMSIGICAVMVFVSPVIYNIWFGDKADVPFTMTLIVAIYTCTYCWMNLNGTVVVGMGTVSLQTIINIIGMVVHIPLSLFLGKHIGAYGVIVSMILINLFYAIFFKVQVTKVLSGKATGIWLK